MASMWNLLAGYAGLVSVGQQAYIGLGAYLVLVLAQHGLDPFLAIPLAAIGCAAIALPVSLLLLRLRGGYFAIATWVVADAFQLVISRFPSLGGGTGAALPGHRRATHRTCSWRSPTGPRWPSWSWRSAASTCCCAAAWGWC